MITMKVRRYEGAKIVVKEYRGVRPDSIARREFGRKSTIHRSADPNSPDYGLITRAGRFGGFVVLGTILSVGNA